MPRAFVCVYKALLRLSSTNIKSYTDRYGVGPYIIPRFPKAPRSGRFKEDRGLLRGLRREIGQIIISRATKEDCKAANV
jgi:hypothetical protein